MPGLIHTMGQIAGGGFRLVYGTAYHDGAAWLANVGGSLLTARWLDFEPVQGGPVLVGITTDDRGQSSALVLGAYSDQPRTPATAPPTAAPPAPKAVVGSGTTTLTATATDTYGAGGWGRWASSQRGGEDVYTGTWGGYTVTGAWFYGTPKPELTGATATRIQFKVPARLNVGASGATTIQVYAHTNQKRPSGDVNRTTGPATLNIPAGFAGGYYDLPNTFAPALAAGGGISIAGGPYAGFQSRLDDPEAGKLVITWTR